MSGIYTADGRLNTKEKRVADLKKSASSAPFSYRTNSTKEELCFEYIQTFLDQYKELYPKRALPYMVAENEYGVKKFVCTSLRPTQIPFAELYDLHECASFLAGYIVYEPLDPPESPPKTLLSPTQTLDSCTGDSFDCAMLLCSFLLGAGYDAYVVYGNAPRFVALRDQRAQDCPLIINSSTNTSTKSRVTASEGSGGAGDSSDAAGVDDYEVRDNSVKGSNFIADAEKKKLEAGKDTFRLWIPSDDDHKAEEDPKRVKRCHAWVLVAAGRREVKENVFIEPATGRPYNPKTAPFSNIVALWNHQNYWVNLQVNTKVAEMKFDLDDGKAWENVFLVSNKASSGEQGEEQEQDGGMTEGKEEEEGETPAGYEINRAFDCPSSWVDPLSLDRPRYLLRFPPSGKRMVLYHKAKAYFYARGVSRQCLSMKIILYLDLECTIVREIHEWFENRSDKLYKRVRSCLDSAHTIDYYHPGSLGGVSVWTEYPGKKTIIDFNVDSRLDRLYRRVEALGSKVEEYFDGRSDLMSYRAFDLTTDKTAAGARQFATAGGSLADEVYVLKMIVKFSQPENPGPDDVATRIFSVPLGKLTAYYHFEKSKITGKVRTFLHTRGPSIPVMSEQALMQELGLEEDPEELQEDQDQQVPLDASQEK